MIVSVLNYYYQEKKGVIIMKTRITQLFGIKYPIILPGMSWISTPELVAAVCNNAVVPLI